MRNGLRWLLGVTLLLTALAMWWPQPMGETLRTRLSQPTPDTPVIKAPSTPAPKQAVLPEHLPEAALEPAKFDPFVGVQPPPPKPVIVAPAPTPVAPPPPQPTAPPLNYRFLGRMTDPSGVQRIYLARGDSAMPVSVGTRLDEGYVVQSIDATGIRLHYPSLDAHAVIPVPAEQNSSNR